MKSFALTSTSPTQIDLCYVMKDPVQKNGLAAHLYYNNGNWIGSGHFNSRDLIGGIFLSDLVSVAALATKPITVAHSAAEPHLGIGPPIAEYPRLDIFGLGTDYAMWHQTIWKSVPDSPPQWTSLGGSFLSTPAAIEWHGRIDVFGLGTDRAVFHKSLQGLAWSANWERLGGIMSSEVSAVSWGRINSTFLRVAQITPCVTGLTTAPPG